MAHLHKKLCSTFSGSKIRLVTLDVTIMLVRQLVIANEKSFLSDDHFAQVMRN